MARTASLSTTVFALVALASLVGLGTVRLLDQLLLPAAAVAEPPTLVEVLRGGGHVLVFRHGATHADQADTDPLNPNNIAGQRHLNDQGRAFAREIGAKLRAKRVPVTEVYASSFRRTVETAELMGFGAVTTTLDIAEGGMVVSPNEAIRRADAFRTLCRRPLPAGANRLIVSHKSNIIDAFGKDWFDIQEGEAAVFRVEPEGRCTLVARVRPEQWDVHLK